MENASKALLMAGAILIGMIIISMGVYLFRSGARFGSTFEQRNAANEILKFNTQFDVYYNRDDITAHDIKTAYNIVKRYNDSIENQEAVIVELKMKGQTTKNVANIDNLLIDTYLYNFVEKNGAITTDIKTYICEKIEYNNKTGRISRVVFRENT